MAQPLDDPRPGAIREFWFLVLLESTLFLCWPFWEQAVIWTAPRDHPLSFAAVTIGSATLALLLTHLGPALFAFRWQGGVPAIAVLLIVWLAAGYLEWIVILARLIAQVLPWGMPSNDLNLALVAATFVSIVCAGWIRSIWKPVTIATLALGAGILLWAVATTWPGLWARNPFFSQPRSELTGRMATGALVSAAPAFVIAWRLGRVARSRRQIWLGGIAGVWLPIVLSTVAGALAVEGGLNLYWHPSLPRGFQWALLGLQGRLTPSSVAAATLTMVAPALVSVFSLRTLAESPEWQWRRWLLPAASIPVILGFSWLLQPGDGVRTEMITPFHEFWAYSILVLGALAGLRILLQRPDRAGFQ